MEEKALKSDRQNSQFDIHSPNEESFNNTDENQEAT